MITYFLENTDYDLLVNGYDFGINTPQFVDIDNKKYITQQNWDLWSSSRPNELYILDTFPEFASVDDFVTSKFLALTLDQYEAHKTNFATDDLAFIQKEAKLCQVVQDDMAAELNKQLRENTINALQGLQLQELFSKQEPMAIASLGGTVLNISIMGYLGQNKSLNAALLRLSNTPIDVTIGFTQELKDRFIALMSTQINILNA